MKYFRRMRRAALKSLLAFGVVIVMGLNLYGCAMDRRLAAEYGEFKRDPQTGVIVGAETRELGDPNSPRGVLLVHGFIGTGMDFGELPESLAKEGYRVRVLRLPGHGTHPTDLCEQTMQELEATVARELETMKQQHGRVDLVAFSMGGALSIAAAAENPPDRLVLIAPFFDVRDRWFYGLNPFTWNRMFGGMIEYVPKFRMFCSVDRPEGRKQVPNYGSVPTSFIRDLGEYREKVQDPQRLARITCPVLVLQGEKDCVVSPKATREGFRNLGSKEKKIVFYPRSNHILFWDWDRDAATQEVVQFLQAG